MVCKTITVLERLPEITIGEYGFAKYQALSPGWTYYNSDCQVPWSDAGGNTVGVAVNNLVKSNWPVLGKDVDFRVQYTKPDGTRFDKTIRVSICWGCTSAWLNTNEQFAAGKYTDLVVTAVT